MSSNRITYIDALRGFTMILVVMNHVTSKCFGAPFLSPDEGVYSYTVFLREFRMPLFFFISGFVLFRLSDIWDIKHFVAFFKKKIPVQLFSPLLFFLVYLFVNGISLHDGLFSPTKNGYWFTFTLLEFYVFYAIARCICLKLKLSSNLTDILLVLYGIAFTSFRVLFKEYPIHDLLIMEKWYLFIYLVLGTLARKHFVTFERSLDKGTIVVVSVLLYFGLNIFYCYLPLEFVFNQILAVSGIIIVFAFFRKNCGQPSKSTFTEQTEGKMGKVSVFQQFKSEPLQFIGRRTLDIYLLHFFILPTQLSEFFTVFSRYEIPVIELACSLLVSLVVIIVCLIIGEVIRISPNMAHWVFGAKLEQTDSKSKEENK